MKYCTLVSLILAGNAWAQCDTAIDLGRGPITVTVPSDYDPEVPLPLILMLHGYGGNGNGAEAYFRFRPLAEEYGFVYANPQGTQDAVGRRFWNATDACCNFFGSDVDDSGYIRAVVEAIQAQCNIDPRRIYVGGHSNGGFMSYRLGCDHADLFAGIGSLAGMTFLDEQDCQPSEPVHALHMHGTSDNVIFYNGGCINNCYPSAVESVETWAAYNGCDGTSTRGPAFDFDSTIGGDDTRVDRYRSDCTAGGSTELWTILAGSHSPRFTEEARRRIVEFFLAHPKPLPCDGSEKVKAKCKPKNGAFRVKVKLKGGAEDDSVQIELSTGEITVVRLPADGKTKLTFEGLEAGERTVEAVWGCGTIASRSTDCS